MSDLWASNLSARPLGSEAPIHDSLALARKTSRWAGGGFSHHLLSMRSSLFHLQTVQGSCAADLQVSTGFYERHRSVAELRAAVYVNQELCARGGLGRFGRLPSMLTIGIYPSIFDAPGGIVPMPATNEKCIGFHIVHPMRVADDGFVFVHNWRKWGYGGFGWLSLEYISSFAQEASTFRLVPGPEGLEGRTGGNENQQILRMLSHAWDLTDVPVVVRVSTHAGVTVVGRCLIGAGSSSSWYQGIAIADHPPVAVGWFHGRLSAGHVQVEEIFVWPPYRGRAIGATLLAQSLVQCAELGARTATLVQSIPDATLVGKCGLAWVSGTWTERRAWGVERELTIDLLPTLESWALKHAGITRLQRWAMTARDSPFHVVGPTNDHQTPQHGVVTSCL